MTLPAMTFSTVLSAPRRAALFRLARIAAPVLVLAALGACATLIGPRQVEVPLEKLQAGVERRFPLNNRVMSLLDVQLTNPRLSLLPESDRIALAMEVSVAPPLMRQSWHGTLALSGHLVIDMARNGIYLGEVRVDKVDIDGVDEGRQRQFAQAANLMVERLVKDLALHTFKPEELRYAGVQFAPTRIVTTPTALLISVEPVK